MENIIKLILLFLSLDYGHGLSCYTCGDDGICADGVETKTKQCDANTKGCMISIQKIGDNYYDMKDCFQTTDEVQVRGCVQITNEHGVKLIIILILKKIHFDFPAK